MKEMKALVVMLAVFVVAVLGLMVYKNAQKTAAPAAPSVEETAAVQPEGAAPAATEASAPSTTEASAPAAPGSGIRGTDLLETAASELPAPESQAPAPGQAERLPRAYENAPPQIPHSIEGLVPIPLSNNACFSCHDPSVAESTGATPLPPTHIKMDLFSKSEAKKVPVDPARYYCTQCHVPQANVQPPVANEFQPEFRNPELKNKSDLDQKWNEGVQ